LWNQNVTAKLPTNPKPKRRGRRRRRCLSCGVNFAKVKFCSRRCAGYRAPGVYRFVCPDGRSYVGAVGRVTNRGDKLARSNRRLQKAFKKYPPGTWRFELLETLPGGCTVAALRAAEQRHIDRFCTYKESSGFNVFPAVYAGNGPAQKAGRRFKRKILSEMKERQREFLQAWRAERSVESHVQKNRPGVEAPGAAK
jgi:hypothetical protein